MSDEAPLDEDQQRTLASVLDRIVPPSSDGRLPGAGGLGLATDVERAVDATPALRPVIALGLTTLGELARRRHPQGFSVLAEGERTALLDELAATDAAFLPTLAFLTYTAYYQHADVLRALGLEPRPPHPKGYEMEENDPALLEPVRRRARLYRDC